MYPLGAYVVIAYHCSLVLYHRYKTKRLHKYLLGTHIALFLLITWVCSMSHFVYVSLKLFQRCTATIARTLYGTTHVEPDGTINLHPAWSTWSLVENSPWVMVTIVADAFIVGLSSLLLVSCKGLILSETGLSHVHRLDAEMPHNSYSSVPLCRGHW